MLSRTRISLSTNQKLELTRWTCHFVYDQQRRRVLFLALVRSQFEHCSIIWRPQSETKISKLEALRKRAIKWILSEANISGYQASLVPPVQQKQQDLGPCPLTHI